MTQLAGQRTALTFTTALLPGGATWLKTFFAVADNVPAITAPLRRYQIIHFANWAIVERFPGAPDEAVPRPLLVFQSNFDNDLPEYVDTFAMLLPWRFRAVWFTSSGYPGLIPPDGFYRWVLDLQATPGHYYSAYEDSQTPTVTAALALDGAVDELVACIDELDPDEFEAEYRRMLTEVQAWL